MNLNNCDFCQEAYDIDDSTAMTQEHFCSRGCEGDQAREDEDRRESFEAMDTRIAREMREAEED